MNMMLFFVNLSKGFNQNINKKCKNKKYLRNEITVYWVILAILPMFDPINPPIFVPVMPLPGAN